MPSSTNALLKAFSEVYQAQKVSELLPEGFDVETVSKSLLDAISDGSTSEPDFSLLLDTGLSVAGAAACSATGIGIAFAPVCGAATSIVGDIIKGIFSSPDPPPPPKPPQDSLLKQEVRKDAAKLVARRTALLADTLAKVGTDKTAIASITDIVNDFFPKMTFDDSDYSDAFTVRFVEIPSPEFEAGEPPKVAVGQAANRPYGGGFYLPLLPPAFLMASSSWKSTRENAANFVRMGQSCQTITPGTAWIGRYLSEVSDILSSYDLDVEAQMSAIDKSVTAAVAPGNKIEQGTGAKIRYASCVNSNENGLVLYQTTREFLWPLLENELKLRLKRLFAGLAMRSASRLASAIEKTTMQLAKEANCVGATCMSEIRGLVSDSAGKFDTPIEAVTWLRQQLKLPDPDKVPADGSKPPPADGSKPPPADGSKPPPAAPPPVSLGPSVLATVAKGAGVLLVASAATLGVAAGVRKAQGKAPLPPAVARAGRALLRPLSRRR